MNRSFVIQNLKQMWGLIKMEYRYQGSYPSPETYQGRSGIRFPSGADGLW